MGGVVTALSRRRFLLASGAATAALCLPASMPLVEAMEPARWRQTRLVHDFGRSRSVAFRVWGDGVELRPDQFAVRRGPGRFLTVEHHAGGATDWTIVAEYR